MKKSTINKHKQHTILLTGVPGVGKTTIAESLATQFNIPVVNFGSVLFTNIQKKHLHIKHVDDIRTQLNYSDYLKLQKTTAQDIAKVNGNKIITSHLSIDTPTGFKPGFPQEIVDILKPSIVFIIESPVDEIKKRRLSDKTERRRGQKLENWIEFHQNYNRALAANYSFYTGNYTYPILNKQGQLEQACDEANHIVATILS
ncbi:MAG: AAA family ATPase [Patescibacteria group bacterium]